MGEERGTRSQDARSKPEDEEIDIAKMAGLYKEEKLGKGTESRSWAGELG